MDADSTARWLDGEPGFSLAEILVVTALVMILAGLAIPASYAVTRFVYDGMALNDLVSVRTAVESGIAAPKNNGTTVTVGPAALAMAPNVRISPRVRMRVQVQELGNGRSRYTIRSRHLDGTAEYTADETGKLEAAAVKS